jgi:hypothetical protein
LGFHRFEHHPFGAQRLIRQVAALTEGLVSQNTK